MHKDSHRSSPGIGAAIARNLASKGASLVLGYASDKSAELTTKICNELESSHGINALGVQADSESSSLYNVLRRHASDASEMSFESSETV